jgi:23S rRNA pseudouridine2605 synthase
MLGEAMTHSDDNEPQDAPHEGERIAKVIARAGLASRREAEAWIVAGRVAVNGKTLTSAALNITPSDKVAIDGKPLPARERTRLWLYHKPRGLVTTARDPEGRTTVFEVLPPELPRVVSVGRLDLTTEGLLLLTNDGGLARVLAHPDTAWLRRYRVRAFGQVDLARLTALKDGIEIDGFSYGPIEAELDRQQGDNAWLTLGLREGKNREVRRVLEHLGLSVNRLIRLSFGPFQLGDLGEGAVEEIRTRYLKEQLGGLADEAECDFEAPMIDRTPETVKKAVRVRSAAKDEPQRRASLTTDRKGRQVLVERFGEKPAPKPRKPRPPKAGARDERPRTGARGAPAKDRARGDFGRPERPAAGRGDFRPREDRPRDGGDRPARPPRRDGPSGGDRPRSFGAGGGKRKEREERPQEPRPYGNRTRAFKAKPEGEARAPRGGRPDRGERPSRDERARPPREDRPERGERGPRGDRPEAGSRPRREDGPRREGAGREDSGARNFSKAGERSGSRRPGGPRPAGSAPPRERPSGPPRERSGGRSGAREDRADGGRPGGDRPGGRSDRPGGGRPFGKPGGRPDGDRPRPSGGKPGGRPDGDRPRPSGGKPGGRPSGGKPGGRSSGGRPPGGKPSGGRPSGGKPGGRPRS